MILDNDALGLSSRAANSQGIYPSFLKKKEFETSDKGLVLNPN